MARIHGEAGDTEFRKFSKPILRLLMSFLVIIGLIGFMAGGVLMVNVWLLGPVVLLEFVLLRIFEAKGDKQLKELKNHVKGASGEIMIGSVLEELPDDFCVFHDFHCDGLLGNIDHIVVGSTGIFAVETKNWTGTVATVAVDARTRDLRLNGRPCDKDFAGDLRGRAKVLKEKIDRQIGNDVTPFVQPVMVFPNSYLDQSAGELYRVDLKKSEQLIDYLRSPRPSRELAPEQVKKIEQVLVAMMAHRQK